MMAGSVAMIAWDRHTVKEKKKKNMDFELNTIHGEPYG